MGKHVDFWLYKSFNLHENNKNLKERYLFFILRNSNQTRIWVFENVHFFTYIACVCLKLRDMTEN